MDKEQVRHIATLARLHYSEAGLEAFTGQLNDILKYVEQLSLVDTRGVAPMAQPTPLVNVTRADVTRPCLTHEQVFLNTRHHEEGYFEVPAVLAEEAEE